MDRVICGWLAGIGGVVALTVYFFSSLPADRMGILHVAANVILFSVIIAFISSRSAEAYQRV